jgi:hypothetical protein
MSVPTHNLYDFVHQTTKKQFWLFYFYPWGSRDLNNLIDYQLDLDSLNGIPVANRFDFEKFNVTVDYTCKRTHDLTRWTQPVIFCHDQEPLNFDRYNKDSELIANYTIEDSRFNHLSLKKIIPHSIYKKSILLHSELNSAELNQFEDTDLFAGAYWWSHAVIARDWYRYAQYDSNLTNTGATHKTMFLVYCRDFTGSRQYRKTFVDQIQQHNLTHNCRLLSNNLTVVDPNLSAEYNSADFMETAISIVLETIFDSRIHLTEKTLRPIACGHPFLLANGPGSLKLLQSYGFKTFNPFINEHYDSVVDNEQRLDCIVTEMTRLNSLPAAEINAVLTQCKEIADYNKKWFFSDDFLKIIVDELTTNINSAHHQIIHKYTCNQWLDQRRKLRKNRLPVNKDYQRATLIKLIRELRKAYGFKACR